jgi:hypothetical protein
MPDQGQDGPLFKELAQRLLTYPHPEGPMSVELFLRAFPESLTVDLPMPAESKLIGGALHSRRGELTHMESVFDTPREPEEAVAAYERFVTERGWSPFEALGGMSGGFRPSGLGIGRSFRHGDQGPVLMISARSRESLPVDLRLRLDWEIIRRLPEMRRHAMPDGAQRLPGLHTPEGMPMRGGSGGGGGGSWHSEASVETDLPVPDLHAYFDQQLERAGWKRDAGSADAGTGWSSWLLPGDGSWRGLMLVLATRPGKRFLYVRIESDDATGGGGYSTGPMIMTRA